MQSMHPQNDTINLASPDQQKLEDCSGPAEGHSLGRLRKFIGSYGV